MWSELLRADAARVRAPTRRLRSALIAAEVATACEAAVGEALRNVRRHTPPGTAVRIDIGVDPGGWWVEVDDDGPGFEPSVARPAGMGIGLSIVGRMRAVGGSGVVRSRPGAGTHVRLEGPTVEEVR